MILALLSVKRLRFTIWGGGDILNSTKIRTQHQSGIVIKGYSRNDGQFMLSHQRELTMVTVQMNTQAIMTVTLYSRVTLQEENVVKIK